MNCNGECLECKFDDCIKPLEFDLKKAIRNRRYYKRHREKEMARSTEYAKEHRAQINEQKRKTYNPEQRRVYYLNAKKRMIEGLGAENE